MGRTSIIFKKDFGTHHKILRLIATCLKAPNIHAVAKHIIEFFKSEGVDFWITRESMFMFTRDLMYAGEYKKRIILTENEVYDLVDEVYQKGQWLPL